MKTIRIGPRSLTLEEVKVLTFALDLQREDWLSLGIRMDKEQFTRSGEIADKLLREIDPDWKPR